MKGGEAATLVERCLDCEADGTRLRNLLNALDVPASPICVNLCSSAVGILFSRPFVFIRGFLFFGSFRSLAKE